MTQLQKPERVINDARRECESCPAPGLFSFRVQGFTFNYCHKHLKESQIALNEIENPDFSPIEELIKEAFRKWKKDQ